jgi:hypothetical protein
MMHDSFVMLVTAFAIFGAIRVDLKFIRNGHIELRRAFDEHMTKYHENK